MDSVTGVFHGIPTDFLILGVTALLLVLVALYGGVANLVAISLASFVAMAFIPLLAHTALISRLGERLQDPTSQPVVFLAIFVPLFIMLRWVTQDTFEDTGPIQAILAGCATTIVILIIWQNMPTLTSIWDFGGFIDVVFGQTYQFWWLIGALLTLTFARG